MQAKILLIGQAPSRTGDPNTPLLGRLGNKITSICGLTESEYRRQFDRRNVLPKWPGRNGKGDAFPLNEARKRARRMLPDITSRRVIFIGKNSARAFGFKANFLTWQTFANNRAAILPHPSGINRWWNDPKNRRRAGRFMKSAART